MEFMKHLQNEMIMFSVNETIQTREASEEQLCNMKKYCGTSGETGTWKKQNMEIGRSKETTLWNTTLKYAKNVKTQKHLEKIKKPCGKWINLMTWRNV